MASDYSDFQDASGLTDEGHLRARFFSLYRPMTVQEIMDDAIALYREGFWTMLRLSALPWIPALALALLFLFPIVYFSAVGSPSDEMSAVMMVNWIYLIFAILIFVSSGVLQGIQSAMISLAGSGHLLGHRPTAREAINAFKPHLGNLIANQVLASLIVSVFYTVVVIALWLFLVVVIGVMMGTSAAVGPATVIWILIVMLIFSLVLLLVWAMGLSLVSLMPQIIVLEGKNPIEAFQRNVDLVRKHYWRVVGYYFAIMCLQAILMMAAYIVFAIFAGLIIGLLSIFYNIEALFERWFFALNHMTNVLGFIVSIVVMPPVYLCSLLIYYDLRFRSEALDVHLLVQEVTREQA